MPALILLIYLSLFIFSLLENTRGPLYPDILTAFGVTSGLGSLFFAVTSLFAFVGSYMGHKFLKRRSSANLLILSTLLFGFGFGAMAVAPQFFWLIIASAVFGFGLGSLNFAQNYALIEVAPEHLRRRLLNGLHSMYGLAALLSPIAVSVMRWNGLDWRRTMMVLSLIPFLWVVRAWPVFRKRRVALKAAKPETGELKNFMAVFVYALMVAGYLWGEIAVTTRIVYWLRVDHGYSPDEANFLMSAFCGLFLFGRLIFSFVPFSHWSNWDLLRYSAISSSILMIAGLSIHPYFMVISGLAMAPFYPVAMDQASQSFSRQSSQALGFIIGFGSFSVVLMHVTLGQIADYWSLTRALFLCALALFLVFAGLQIRSSKRRSV